MGIRAVIRLIGIVHGRDDQQRLDRCTHQDIRHHIAARVADERCAGTVSLWTGLGKDIVKLKVSRVIVAGVVIQAFLSRFHSELQRVPPTDIAQVVFRLIVILGRVQEIFAGEIQVVIVRPFKRCAAREPARVFHADLLGHITIVRKACKSPARPCVADHEVIHQGRLEHLCPVEGNILRRIGILLAFQGLNAKIGLGRIRVGITPIDRGCGALQEIHSDVVLVRIQDVPNVARNHGFAVNYGVGPRHPLLEKGHGYGVDTGWPWSTEGGWT